jgi:hypothetical protein
MIQDLGSVSNKRIELVDITIEHSNIICRLLDVICATDYGKAEDAEKADVVIASTAQCIKLAKKYECRNASTILQSRFVRAIEYLESYNKLEAFSLAIEIEDYVSASAVIRRYGHFCWVAAGTGDNGHVKDSHIFDLTGLPLAVMEKWPVKVIWALLRACRGNDSVANSLGGTARCDSKDDWGKVEVRFRSLMDDNSSKSHPVSGMIPVNGEMEV